MGTAETLGFGGQEKHLKEMAAESFNDHLYHHLLHVDSTPARQRTLHEVVPCATTGVQGGGADGVQRRLSTMPPLQLSDNHDAGLSDTALVSLFVTLGMRETPYYHQFSANIRGEVWSWDHTFSLIKKFPNLGVGAALTMTCNSTGQLFTCKLMVSKSTREAMPLPKSLNTSHYAASPEDVIALLRVICCIAVPISDQSSRSSSSLSLPPSMLDAILAVRLYTSRVGLRKRPPRRKKAARRRSIVERRGGAMS